MTSFLDSPLIGMIDFRSVRRCCSQSGVDIADRDAVICSVNNGNDDMGATDGKSGEFANRNCLVGFSRRRSSRISSARIVTGNIMISWVVSLKDLHLSCWMKHYFITLLLRYIWSLEYLFVCLCTICKVWVKTTKETCWATNQCKKNIIQTRLQLLS